MKRKAKKKGAVFGFFLGGELDRFSPVSTLKVSCSQNRDVTFRQTSLDPLEAQNRGGFFLLPPGWADVASEHPPAWPPWDTWRPPATFKVRAVTPASWHFHDETLIHSGRALCASPRGPVSITRPPAELPTSRLSVIPSPLGEERFQLDSNGECQRSLKSWAQAVSPECSAGLWNTPNYDKAPTF